MKRWTLYDKSQNTLKIYIGYLENYSGIFLMECLTFSYYLTQFIKKEKKKVK